MPAPREGKRLGREWAIHELMNAKGLTLEEADARLAAVQKEYGVNYHRFGQVKGYHIESDDFRAEYDRLFAERSARKKVKKAANVQARKDEDVESIPKIMEVTGWDEATTLAQVKAAGRRSGVRPSQYYYYQMFKRTPKEQKQFFGRTINSALFKKYPARGYMDSMLGDKERSNYFFAEYIKRPWCVNTRISEQDFIDRFAGETRLFYKPINDHQGKGAESINLENMTLSEAYAKLKDYPEGVVEGYIRQHPKMNELSPTAVNTLRIVTLSSLAEPVDESGAWCAVAYATLKMGGVTGCVDNLAGGGLAAGVDLETGTLCTNAVNENLESYEYHPVTGTKVKGFEIPYYREAVEMALDALNKYQIEGYLGWDIALTETGPELVELNTTPAPVLFQLPYSFEGKGVGPHMRKFL